MTENKRSSKKEIFLRRLRFFGHALETFLVFLVLIAFVITVSFLLFFSQMELNEDDVRAIAPAVFFNAVMLAVLFSLFDTVRRYLTVERPTREMLHALERLMNGDFTARVSEVRMGQAYNNFGILARQINRLGEELGGVETLRSDFIANVSHELKTPLSIMQNYATLLRSPHLSEEERQEYSRKIYDASVRLTDLVTNILRLNKLDNQQIFSTTQEETYDLCEQLRECLLDYEEKWEEKRLNIETDIPDRITVTADAELLSLVWHNLISNAIKFTEPEGTVSVELTATEDSLSVTVRDTGCGMTPEVGAHIFEKFYQGDTSHATAGNGLGLALVKRVVDILHGDIRVESTLGTGSAFTVTLRRDDHV
ncbi:MAG: HAMP domain-containing histidine kinase [Clostridia bacterium]|nr:HAMP domain-containing histidine kinase [Clostridia bacterium]